MKDIAHMSLYCSLGVNCEKINMLTRVNCENINNDEHQVILKPTVTFGDKSMSWINFYC
jgi:hypothetical protein